MAELDVQPKKGTSWLPWLLAGLVILVLLFFLLRNKDSDDRAAGAFRDTTNHAAIADPDRAWDDIDWNSSFLKYDEVHSRNVTVRGNENYAIYSVGEDILFDKGQSNIRPDAEKDLQDVVASIEQRYDGDVRVYGYTDSEGTEASNKELAADRAAAVQSWLAAHSKISGDRISLHPMGEVNPAATNATEEGKQMNRRVSIVARRTQ
jgi:outer membrane protein OmpA-like peptidoglycan-associated protein